MYTLHRRHFLGSAAAAGLTAACAPVPALTPPEIAPTPAALDPLLAGMAEQILAEYPENATLLGIDTGSRAPLRHRLTDRSAAGRTRLAGAARARLTRLKSLDLRQLDSSAKLDAAVALAAHEITDEGYRFPYGDVINLDQNIGYRNMPYVVNQLSGAFVELPDFLVSRHTVATAEDAEAYADRVDAYAGTIEGETERLAHDRAIGVVAPDFLLDQTIKMIAAGAGQVPSDNGLVKTLSAADAKAGLGGSIVERVRQSLAARVNPALARQAEELKRHRAVANSNAGVWDLPDGEAYYRWALKAGTTTNRTPADIHQLGIDQLRVIQERMDGLLRKQGMSGGTVGARMAALGKDPKQIYPNTDAGRAQLLAYLNGRVADVRARLPRAFATLVPGNLIIKRVPPEIEAGAPGGYASAGSIDGKVPGQYYINLRDTAEVPRFTLPTLTYHEGIPGHVWQGEYSNRMALIRSLLAFNAYSEGWALYAEQLADELGVYDNDPYGALGYLQSSAFRACRLMVDTGLHAMRWTRAQGIDFFVTNNGDDAGSITTEVDRYCAWPGQACGYKVGHLEIVRLRDKAKATLGPRYDLRTFDDAVVQGGSVPMTLLETVIDGYIAKARA
ncbi:MAG: DUF885 family protein [Sphingomicrobium sp.]